MPPLSAAELVAHPLFGKDPWEGKPTKEGLLDVAKGRGGPFKVWWEIHGHGDVKLMWVMGLGAFSSAWWRQTAYFGHTHSSTYSSLIIDNRGMGRSAKPLLRYSTSEMALDVLEVAESLGWTDPRTLHIIGVSMGGMIAQELAYKAPERIASLCLISTAPQLVNEIGFFANLRQRTNLFVPREVNFQLADTKRRLFGPGFCDAPDQDAVDFGAADAWPTNGDRFGADELKKRSDVEGFTRKGFVLQAIAAGWHCKSDSQLRELAEKVGRERILVVHGMKDAMITFTHAEMLRKGLNGGVDAEKGVGWKVWEEKGHMLPYEVRAEFNEEVERFVQRCRRLPS